jgi:hypothetical protein
MPHAVLIAVCLSKYYLAQSIIAFSMASKVKTPKAKASQRLSDEELLAQLQAAKRQYVSFGYTMSIGELISMYKEGELVLNPTFQRLFRWSIQKQSRFIESIFMGLPLPAVFVYHNSDGKWEVIDGLQRLSTIFSFVGALDASNGQRNSNGKKHASNTVLEATKHMPYLAGLTWKDLPEKARFEFKREGKMEVYIIKHTSDSNAKFEVFQRLNAGTVLSGQEYRNALMNMVDAKLYQWLIELSQYEDFRQCIQLSDKWLEEKYDQELVLRLFIFSRYKFSKGPIDEFLNDCLLYNEDAFIQQLQTDTTMVQTLERQFKQTFDWLYAAKGKTVFQKAGKGSQFLESYFEAIAIGLFYNIEQYDNTEAPISQLQQKIDAIEEQAGFAAYKAGKSGTNADKRISTVIPFGKAYFAPQHG